MSGFRNPTAEDRRRLPELVAKVLEAAPPVQGLLDVMTFLEEEQNPTLAVTVFESVAGRIDTQHYWVWFRLARIYTALGAGSEDAAFLAGSLAVQMQPTWPASVQPARALFLIHCQHGRTHAAIDLFLYMIERHPTKPIASGEEIQTLREMAGIPPAHSALPEPGSRLNHRVMEAELPSPFVPRVFGGDMPYSLAALAAPARRSEIDVAELSDAGLLMGDNNLVVFGRDGLLHADLSASEFPEPVARWIERQPQDGQEVVDYEADEAVVILDRFPAPNLCHFLLDQASRLALYEKAGARIDRALVIGPPLKTEYQHEILRRAGVSTFLATNQLARVKVRKLWISTNCRRLEHAGHRGATWVTNFTRELLGGQGHQGWRRIYLSRADTGARHVVNEVELVSLLENYQFEPLNPARMPYEAQLTAFRQASHVISPHGAALAHIMLCPAGARVLEMFHPLYGTSAYATLASSCGVDYAALVGRDAYSDKPEWNDPKFTSLIQDQHGWRDFSVSLEDVQAYLETTLG